MEKKDLIAVIILGEIIALFMFFVLQATGYGGYSLAVLFVILPAIAILGFYIAKIIGKKIPVVFQFVRYALVGVANTAVDLGILNLLIWATGKNEGKIIILLNTISVLIAIVHSYFWNKLWAFGNKNKTNKAIQFIQFVIISLIGTFINTGIVYAMSSLIKPVCGLSQIAWVNAAKIIATIISLIWNFIGYKLIVFKEIKNGKQPGNISQI